MPRSGPASRFIALEVRSTMGASFVLTGARATIDGSEIDRSTSEQTLCVTRAAVQTGTHEIAVDVTLRGNGYGVFAYLTRYRFHARSHARIDLPRDVYGAVAIATVYEAGGVTTPLEDRPQVRWDIRPATHATDGCFPR